MSRLHNIALSAACWGKARPRPGPGSLAQAGSECVRRDGALEWPVSQWRPQRQHHDTYSGITHISSTNRVIFKFKRWTIAPCLESETLRTGQRVKGTLKRLAVGVQTLDFATVWEKLLVSLTSERQVTQPRRPSHARQDRQRHAETGG